MEILDGKTEKSTQRFAKTITEEKTAHQQPTKRVVNKISATQLADFYLALYFCESYDVVFAIMFGAFRTCRIKEVRFLDSFPPRGDKFLHRLMPCFDILIRPFEYFYEECAV